MLCGKVAAAVLWGIAVSGWAIGLFDALPMTQDIGDAIATLAMNAGAVASLLIAARAYARPAVETYLAGVARGRREALAEVDAPEVVHISHLRVVSRG